MKRALILTITLMTLVAGARAWAAESASLAGQLSGKTLSAVAYLPNAPGNSGGRIVRLMLQAYLGADGRALVRVWDETHDRYTAPVARGWRLSGNTLCIDLPNRPVCADVHVWGPKIAGIGTHPYAMLDGDLQPGNTVSVTR